MVTQTVECGLPVGTTSVKLFAPGDVSQSPVASVVPSGRFAEFADIPAGTYRVAYFVNTTELSHQWVVLTLTTATFIAYELPVSVLGGSGGGASITPNLLVSTTINELTSQTVFTLTAGSPDDGAYDGRLAVITDASTSMQKAVCFVSGYVGSTKAVTLTGAAIFEIASGDEIVILADGAVTDFKGNALSLLQAYFTSLIATLQVTEGEIAGFPEQLIAGDSYTEELNRTITILSVNEDSESVFGKGSLLFADAVITGKLARTQKGAADEIGMNVTFETPDGGTPYWKISIPASETRKAVANETYHGQIQHVWTSPAARHTIGGIVTQFTPDAVS